MRKEITINIILDEDTGLVEALDMVEGTYNRVEMVAEEIDNPISVYTAVKWIDSELESYL